MKNRNKRILILILGMLILSSCRLLDLAVTSAGTDQKITQIPQKIDTVWIENLGNSRYLTWKTPSENVFESGEGFFNVAGEDIDNFIYEGVYTPKGYEIERRVGNEKWIAIDTVLTDSLDIVYFSEKSLSNEYDEFYSYRDKTAESVAKYEYRVAPYNGAGRSGWNSVIVTID